MSYRIENFGNFQSLSVNLENYDEEIESLICATNLDELEKSIKQTDEILSVCTNVDNVTISLDSHFQIIMRCDPVECFVCVSDEHIEITHKNDLCILFHELLTHYEFNEFLEIFSKTPFYKRPEFVKVAIKD